VLTPSEETFPLTATKTIEWKQYRLSPASNYAARMGRREWAGHRRDDSSITQCVADL